MTPPPVDDEDPTALRPKDYGWFAVRMVFVVLFWVAAYWALKRTSAMSVSVAVLAWSVWYGVSRVANAKTRVP